MNFGEAIEAMKADPSKRFARKGWNGKNMFIYLTKGRDVSVDDWRGEPPCVVDGVIRLTDHFDMKTADNTILCGWLASQTDMLAEDWYEVKE